MNIQTENPETAIAVVIFRKWNSERNGHDVIALFPNEDAGRGMCQSYMHIEGYGAANSNAVMAGTVPAKPEEYADIKRELESPPHNYKLVVRKRRPH